MTIEHPRDGSAPGIGDPAPDFVLPDEQGQSHSVAAELAKGKAMVLFFMRGEW